MMGISTKKKEYGICYFYVQEMALFIKKTAAGIMFLAGITLKRLHSLCHQIYNTVCCF